MSKVGQFLVLVAGGGSMAFMLVNLIIAMSGDGTVKIDFNSIHEGWAEIAVISVAAFLYPWALIKWHDGD